MQQYSIVISIYGWSAKNILTGKSLQGGFGMLSARISKELTKLLTPSTNSLCVSSMVKVPEDNEFHLWFEKQPINYT